MTTTKKKAILFGAMDTLEREGCSEEEMTRLFTILGQEEHVVLEVVAIRKEVKHFKQALLKGKKIEAA